MARHALIDVWRAEEWDDFLFGNDRLMGGMEAPVDPHHRQLALRKLYISRANPPQVSLDEN